jgi:hypothetical protein
MEIPLALKNIVSYILKVLNAKAIGSVSIHFDGSGKMENVKYGIELTHETKLDEAIIPQ